MVAGEASGDVLAAHLLQSLRKNWPDSKAFGIGGPNMVEQGFEAWWPSEKLAVRGYVEVLRHYAGIVDIRKQLAAKLIANKPSAFIGVDAPDFNLDLERKLRENGIKTVHFISPSVWAWRPERMEKISHAVDLMLCIFPFEAALYAQHGVRAVYVGHPLAPVIPMEPDRLAARARLGLGESDTVVAVLPGSRRSEIAYLAQRFFEAAVLMHRHSPAIRFVVPVAPGLRGAVTQAARAAGALEIVQLLDGQSHAALAACDVTLIASGTATLEAALFKRPMVIGYNMHWLSWQMMKRKQLQPWVGLPNILCQKFAVPEFLQERATPQALADATLAWLNEPIKIAALHDTFSQMHLDLTRDTLNLAADAIQTTLES